MRHFVLILGLLSLGVTTSLPAASFSQRRCRELMERKECDYLARIAESPRLGAGIYDAREARELASRFANRWLCERHTQKLADDFEFFYTADESFGAMKKRIYDADCNSREGLREYRARKETEAYFEGELREAFQPLGGTAYRSPYREYFKPNAQISAVRLKDLKSVVDHERKISRFMFYFYSAYTRLVLPTPLHPLPDFSQDGGYRLAALRWALVAINAEEQPEDPEAPEVFVPPVRHFLTHDLPPVRVRDDQLWTIFTISPVETDKLVSEVRFTLRSNGIPKPVNEFLTRYLDFVDRFHLPALLNLKEIHDLIEYWI